MLNHAEQLFRPTIIVITHLLHNLGHNAAGAGLSQQMLQTILLFCHFFVHIFTQVHLAFEHLRV